VLIHGFGERVQFLHGRHRPRRLAVAASDGTTVDFVLQSNSQTELDARFMQFFGLANSLVAESDLKLRDRLPVLIRTVLPLTPSVGLLSWIADAVTLRELVAAYRIRRGIPVNREAELMASGTVRLEQVLAVSDGRELERTLLSGATDSEDWLERRLNYTCALASTSIFGYLLGLVGRTPDRILVLPNGRLSHLGLMDCFEKQKEPVPFRLTRVLMNALEVSKVEGTLRSSLEGIIAIMRQNTRDLTLILEIFVDEPLGVGGGGLPGDFMLTRLREKLGTDVPVADDVGRLLIEAISPQNQALMPLEWAPWL
jgi:FKBP12-rapamycin complex-associated protein